MLHFWYWIIISISNFLLIGVLVKIEKEEVQEKIRDVFWNVFDFL